MTFKVRNNKRGTTWEFIPIEDDKENIKIIDNTGRVMMYTLPQGRNQYRYLLKERGYEVV